MQRIDDSSLDLLESDIAMWMDEVRSVRSVSALGEPCEAIWTNRRGLGILQLLLHGDPQNFFNELSRSAFSRRYYLSRCAAAGHVDFYCTSSRSEPIFDALAASCFDLARELGRLAPASFRNGEEYEDDFLYLGFLQRWMEGDVSNLSPLLERFELVLDGATSARFLICQALLSRDSAFFDRAFVSLLEERFAEIEVEKQGIADESVCAAAGTHVFVEGLALLRLATAAGIETRREYPLCPSLARHPRTGPMPIDDFAIIAQLAS